MAFVCDPWESYLRQLQDESDAQIAAMERDENLEHEWQLGVDALLDAEDDGADPDDYLPSYAPRPYEVCEPEVFGP